MKIKALMKVLKKAEKKGIKDVEFTFTDGDTGSSDVNKVYPVFGYLTNGMPILDINFKGEKLTW